MVIVELCWKFFKKNLWKNIEKKSLKNVRKLWIFTTVVYICPEVSWWINKVDGRPDRRNEISYEAREGATDGTCRQHSGHSEGKNLMEEWQLQFFFFTASVGIDTLIFINKCAYMLHYICESLYACWMKTKQVPTCKHCSISPLVVKNSTGCL